MIDYPGRKAEIDAAAEALREQDRQRARGFSAWSDKLPTLEGYYWWRDADFRPEVRLVRVKEGPRGTLTVRTWGGGGYSRDLEDWDHGEWQPVEGPRT